VHTAEICEAIESHPFARHCDQLPAATDADVEAEHNRSLRKRPGLCQFREVHHFRDVDRSKIHVLLIKRSCLNQDDTGRPFAVGYGQPPKATQFKKGQPGNPKGRGKGVKNFATEIQSELNTRVAITENGRRKTITKRKAVAKQLVNKAAGGDPKAIPVLLNQERERETRSISGPGPEILCRPEDELVMANIVRRIREMDTPPSEMPTKSATDDPPSTIPQPEDGGPR
jgi:hypothetical protein